MARHRDGDDGLEVIVEDDASEVPGRPAPRRSSPVRRAVAFGAAIGLLTAGLGVVAGWQLHRVRSTAGTQELVTAPAETTTAAAPVPMPTPPAYDLGATGHGGFYGTELELVDRRTTAEGITIRTYLGEEPFECAADQWCPPPECRTGPGAMAALSTDAMVGQGGTSSRPAVISPPAYVAGWGSAGHAEGDPVVWVTVRVPAATTTVALLRGGRLRDTAAPTDGWIVLATRWSENDPVHVHEDSGYESRSPDVADLVVVVAAGEKELGRLPVGQEGGWEGPLPGSCEPPGPPLPAPGEQPADPDAAREAVRAIYAQAWNHTSSRADKLDAIHQPTGVERAMEQAAAGYGQAVGSTLVEVGDIVFTSPTQAQLHFRLTYTGAPSLGHRIGGAVLVDGRWKVLRGTYCEVLSMAGASCSST
jgi:hypothetical protein